MYSLESGLHLWLLEAAAMYTLWFLTRYRVGLCYVRRLSGVALSWTVTGTKSKESLTPSSRRWNKSLAKDKRKAAHQKLRMSKATDGRLQSPAAGSSSLWLWRLNRRAVLARPALGDEKASIQASLLLKMACTFDLYLFHRLMGLGCRTACKATAFHWKFPVFWKL